MESKNMISKKELENYSKLRGIQNKGFAEVDYLQNVLLFIIYNSIGNEVIFKGGTALYKCFNLDRFSEDLDFNVDEKVSLDFIERDLKNFKIEFEKEEEIYENNKKIILKIKGPLYNGIKNSLCRLVLDFSFREETEKKPVLKTIGRFLEEIPSFQVVVMDLEEIFSEKVRAIMTRKKARDVYDLNFLLDLGVKPNIKMINKKLKYYSSKYNKKIFLEKVKEKQDIWETEMKNLVTNIPNFNEVLRKIKKFMLED